MTEENKKYWRETLSKTAADLKVSGINTEINSWEDVKKEQMKIKEELRKRLGETK